MGKVTVSGQPGSAANRPPATRPAGRARRARLLRPAALCGIAGPAVFTLAWIVASLRQRGQSFTGVEISGLAAPDARDPWLMISGFLLLGGCAVPFGAALRAALGGRRRCGLAPAAVQAAGLAAIAAGLLRRDHMLLTAGPQSWHNQAHDVVSAVGYLLLVGAPLLLAGRLRHEPWYRVLPAPLAAAAGASAALLAVFYLAPYEDWDGLVQRIAVTLPLAAMAVVAAWLAARPAAPPAVPCGPGRTGRAPAGT